MVSEEVELQLRCGGPVRGVQRHRDVELIEMPAEGRADYRPVEPPEAAAKGRDRQRLDPPLLVVDFRTSWVLNLG